MLSPDEHEAVFRALADRTRRRILDVLRDHPGLSVTRVAERFDVSRIAITRHVGLLVKAELVVARESRSDGRALELFLNPVPLQRIAKRWTNELDALFAAQAMSIKRIAESDAVRTRKRRRAS